MTPLFPPSDPEGPKVLFIYHEVAPCVPDEVLYRQWLAETARSEGKEIRQVQVVFLSDEALLEMNRQYLRHDEYTDILTFPLEEDPLTADLYISIDRVRDNAGELGVGEEEELARVMVHGILHLCGYGDKDENERQLMRSKENTYLELLGQ